MSIKEKKASNQLTLYRVYNANDCFGRRPSVRSFLPFFFLLCITTITTPETKSLQQHTYRLASFFLSSTVKRKRETPACVNDRPAVLDNYFLYVLFFILLYKSQRGKREPVGKQIEHTKSNSPLSLSMHTLVIIICIQNERESNMSGEEEKNATYKLTFYVCI
jgi:Ca2+/Na+ antiporter